MSALASDAVVAATSASSATSLPQQSPLPRRATSPASPPPSQPSRSAASDPSESFFLKRTKFFMEALLRMGPWFLVDLEPPPPPPPPPSITHTNASTSTAAATTTANRPSIDYWAQLGMMRLTPTPPIAFTSEDWLRHQNPVWPADVADTDCHICLEKLAPSNGDVVSPPCGHIVHVECLERQYCRPISGSEEKPEYIFQCGQCREFLIYDREELCKFVTTVEAAKTFVHKETEERRRLMAPVLMREVIDMMTHFGRLVAKSWRSSLIGYNLYLSKCFGFLACAAFYMYERHPKEDPIGGRKLLRLSRETFLGLWLTIGDNYYRTSEGIGMMWHALFEPRFPLGEDAAQAEREAEMSTNRHLMRSMVRRLCTISRSLSMPKKPLPEMNFDLGEEIQQSSVYLDTLCEGELTDAVGGVGTKDELRAIRAEMLLGVGGLCQEEESRSQAERESVVYS